MLVFIIASEQASKKITSLLLTIIVSKRKANHQLLEKTPLS